LEKVEEKG